MADQERTRAEFEAKREALRKKLAEAAKLTGKKPSDYAAHRAAMAAQSRASSVVGRDIGRIPDVSDPDRRERCRTSIELFGLTYFPNRFYLAVADFHRQAIAKLEECTNVGGLFACALPRGGGKDAWSEDAVIHALVYGLRRFCLFVGATEDNARQSLGKIKGELEGNDRLLEDFPEVCYPIRKLERINNRARGQTHNGRPTNMRWTADSLTLPTIKDSLASGSTIKVVGLTGAIRGLAIAGPNGEHIRPDLVVINDAQTRESARSPSQTAFREAIVQDDILMLAGPDTTIAAIMLCTVIYKNDLSDRFLNREKHPEWQSVRTKMLDAFPLKLDMWDQYAEVRRDGLRNGDKGKAGNDFYTANQTAMDEGGIATWADRKKDGVLTGLQTAMNFYFDNPRGFYAEGQNDPEAAEVAAGSKELTPEAIASRLNGVERFAIPSECTRLVAFIDPGAKVLWFAVAGFNESFGGAIIDYGAFPRQNRQYFAAIEARPTLADQFSACESDAQRVFAGLQGLTNEIMGKTYYRQGGGEMRISLCLIDSGWESKAVYDFIRQSPFSANLLPSKGYARSSTSAGVGAWAARRGERKGHHWRITQGEEGRMQLVQFDPDIWKSFAHAGFSTPLGGRTGITLFGKSAMVHEMIADHLSAEYSVPMRIRGTTFDKWEVKPDKPDNHLFDCIVGTCVTASVAGLEWNAIGTPVIIPSEADEEKWSDLQHRKLRRKES